MVNNMYDPVALISTETPMLQTRHFIVYEINDFVHDRIYYVFDRQLSNTVFYGSMQECFDYVVTYYLTYMMR